MVFLDKILVISSNRESCTFFDDMLKRLAPESAIINLSSCALARRKIIEQDFDLCIINSPLPDETGEDLAVMIASRGICQVIFIVKGDVYDEVSENIEEYGVFTLAKPINRALFWNVLKLSCAAYNKALRLKDENLKLMDKIEDIRLIDRAKCMLIEQLGISENQAHKYIERQAMDKRIEKKEVAQNIIRSKIEIKNKDM